MQSRSLTERDSVLRIHLPFRDFSRPFAEITMRFPLTAALLVAVAVAAPAADVIQADTVIAVKHASVYVRAQNGATKATGSGFVAAAPEGALLVATNAHVVTRDEDAKLSPAKLLERTKAARVTVTFDSGSVAEQSVAAEIVAIDPVIDLALLKVKVADV